MTLEKCARTAEVVTEARCAPIKRQVHECIECIAIVSRNVRIANKCKDIIHWDE